MKQTPAQLIEQKGAALIAERLGMNVVAVRMWKSRNRIPRSAWPELAQHFPELTQDVLRAVEKAAA